MNLIENPEADPLWGGLVVAHEAGCRWIAVRMLVNHRLVCVPDDDTTCSGASKEPDRFPAGPRDPVRPGGGRTAGIVSPSCHPSLQLCTKGGEDMSKKHQAAVVMVAAMAAQAYLGKVAKQQGAALGLPVLAVGLIGYAITAAL